MKIKNVFLLSTLLFTSCILGCSETSSGPSTSSVIMPLAVGNEWVSELKIYYSNGSFDRDTNSYKIINEYSNPDSSHYFEDNYGNIMYNNRMGLWMQLPNTPLVFFQLIYPYPGYIGQISHRDTMTRRINGKEEIIVVTTRITSVNENIITVTDRYACYKYTIDYTVVPTATLIGTTDLYYAPNVGPIRSIDLVLNESTGTFDTALTSQLISYKLENQ